MFRKKQLVEQLTQKEQEISLLSGRIDELNARLKESGEKLSEYQAREAAIVNALTEAESLAKTKIVGAEKWADEIVMQAANEKEQIQKDCEGMVIEAKKEADEIIAQAKNSAQALVEEAQKSLQTFKTSAQRFNEKLEEACSAARARALAFESEMRALSVPEADITELQQGLPEVANVAELHGSSQAKSEAQPLNVPEEYETPAELMRSIYAIEGREMPESVSEAEEEPHVWTIDEINHEASTDDPKLTIDEELNKLIDDVLR